MWQQAAQKLYFAGLRLCRHIFYESTMIEKMAFNATFRLTSSIEAAAIPWPHLRPFFTVSTNRVGFELAARCLI